jgi:hypothetical protein
LPVGSTGSLCGSYATLSSIHETPGKSGICGRSVDESFHLMPFLEI